MPRRGHQVGNARLGLGIVLQAPGSPARKGGVAVRNCYERGGRKQPEGGKQHHYEHRRQGNREGVLAPEMHGRDAEAAGTGSPKRCENGSGAKGRHDGYLEEGDGAPVLEGLEERDCQREAEHPRQHGRLVCDGRERDEHAGYGAERRLFVRDCACQRGQQRHEVNGVEREREEQ